MKYKLGKHDPEPAHIEKALKIADYVPAVLPPIPGMFDSFSNVYAALGVKGAKDIFPMDGNGPDPTLQPPFNPKGYGDCVMAMWAKFKTVCAGLVGQKVIPTANQVVAAYLQRTNGRDIGLNVSDTIDFAIKNGLLGEQPVAKVYIDPTNYDHLRLGIYLFGALPTGIQCTDAMGDQFDNRQPWDGSGEVEGGHGILSGAWDHGENIKILTWGDDQIITPVGWGLVDECWAVASQEMIANAGRFCPGFDAQGLLADLQAIADQE